MLKSRFNKLKTENAWSTTNWIGPIQYFLSEVVRRFSADSVLTVHISTIACITRYICLCFLWSRPPHSPVWWCGVPHLSPVLWQVSGHCLQCNSVAAAHRSDIAMCCTSSRQSWTTSHLSYWLRQTDIWICIGFQDSISWSSLVINSAFMGASELFAAWADTSFQSANASRYCEGYE